MASVDWKNKLKSAHSIKSQLRHCDRDSRLKSNHANENINKDLTQYNLQTCDYATACKRFDDKIAYLESLPKKNTKADRVLALGLEIPIPDGIPNSKLREFTIKVDNIIKEKTGIQADDVVATYVHVDEVHDYIDSHTKQERTSMRHIHKFVIPNINNKLNGKVFSSRKNITAVNNAIEKMCMEDYGVHFLTGEKTKSNESVESLKLKSKALELEQRENLVEQREEAVAYDERELDKREQAITQRESDLEAYDRITHRKREEADKKLSEANAKLSEVKQREEAVRQAENAMVIQNAAILNRIDELEEAEQDLRERKRNFNAEVQKAAASIVERQKQATATFEEFQKKQKQYTREIPKFDDDDEE